MLPDNKIYSEFRPVPSLDIWNEYEIKQSFKVNHDFQEKLFKFCRQLENEIGHLKTDIFKAENRTPFNEDDVRKALGEMDIDSLAMEKCVEFIEKSEKTIQLEFDRMASSNLFLQRTHDETLKKMRTLEAQMDIMAMQMEHMELPSRFQEDDNKIMMFLDGRWSEAPQEYLDGVLEHYIQMGEGLFMKMPFERYKEIKHLTKTVEAAAIEKDTDDEIPF